MSLHLYTIPPGLPFGRLLAEGLLDRTSADPGALSKHLILLPTRRACRALRDIFLDLTHGKPLLLPRMKPLGDVDAEELALGWPDLEDLQDNPSSALDIPPAMPPLRRRLLLARVILGRGDVKGGWEEALALADTLGRFLDQMIIEEKDFADLAHLVPQDYADHWQITLQFLEILTQNWPEILREAGCIDAALRRRLLMDTQARSWQSSPPHGPVIAAGSTGSIPATARLLKVIAALPQGEVILPGFDKDLEQESWDSLESSHPQFGFKQLFGRMEINADSVSIWPGIKTYDHGRALLAREIMRPAATTELWRALGTDKIRKDELLQSLTGLEIVECESPREEAGVLALALRDALSEPGRTAALVTPDRKLAVAVSRYCNRWDLSVDDSAGITLDKTSPGCFLLLLAECCREKLRPAPFLALLRHELCALDQKLVDSLEYVLLRGPRPKGGFEGLNARLARWRERSRGSSGADEKTAEELEGFLRLIEPLLEPLLRIMDTSNHLNLQVYAEAHLRAAELLSETGRLWQGEAGEHLSNLMSEFLNEGQALGAISAEDYLGLLRGVLASGTIRPRMAGHPRLMILGQLEARLTQADTILLGGLNEGTWPSDPGHDPWMSRPMRRALGLPDAERSIGLAAHDFVQGLGAKRVLLTRSKTVNGSPAVPARWLQRFWTVLQAAGIDQKYIRNDAYRSFFHLIDKEYKYEPTIRPAPTPPLSARPKKISLTGVQTWLEDPYQIYARYVLKLNALEPIEKPFDAAGRGDLLHGVLESFVHDFPEDLPNRAHDILLEKARAHVQGSDIDEDALSFWWPRFAAVSEWFLNQETLWRAKARPLAQEARGEWIFKASNGETLTLRGRADRIDRLRAGSSYAVIDYKSGGQFSSGEISGGKKPQLALEALMLAGGGFDGLAPGPAHSLAYWVMKGGRPAGYVVEVTEQTAQACEGAETLLETLTTHYSTPGARYPVQPDTGRIPAFNDYEHLARLKEWGSGEDESGEAG